jgi:hypothetical protein
MPFGAGNNANPSGRPVGTKDWRLTAKEMLSEKGPELLQRAIDLADRGDPDLLKFVLSHTLVKPRENRFVGGLDLAKLNYPQKMIRLDEHLNKEKIDLDTWKTMRDSYMRQFEIEILRTDNEDLKRQLAEIKELLKV